MKSGPGTSSGAWRAPSTSCGTERIHPAWRGGGDRPRRGSPRAHLAPLGHAPHDPRARGPRPPPRRGRAPPEARPRGRGARRPRPARSWERASSLARTSMRDGRSEVRLPPDLRTRHTHLVGASGTGKSTLLVQLILEDLTRGRRSRRPRSPRRSRGRDPRPLSPRSGRTTSSSSIPSDDHASGSAGTCSHARTEIEKVLLSSDLVAVFRRLSTSWGDQMTSVLGNAIQAFLESRTGGTLLDLRRFLVDRDFRAEFLRTVDDPEVRYYWRARIPAPRREAPGADPHAARYLPPAEARAGGRRGAREPPRLPGNGRRRQGLPREALPGRDRRGERRAPREPPRLRLPPGGALPPGSRARQPDGTSPSTWTSATTWRLPPWPRSSREPGSTGSSSPPRTRNCGQLRTRDPEVLSALLANAGTRIVFRVGEADARELERGFSYFAAADLVNLRVGEAVSRVGALRGGLQRADPGACPVSNPRRRAPGGNTSWLSCASGSRCPMRNRRMKCGRCRPVPISPPAAKRRILRSRSPPPHQRPRAAEDPRPAPPAPGTRRPRAPVPPGTREAVGASPRASAATIEKPILDGKGKVDVALRTEGHLHCLRDLGHHEGGAGGRKRREVPRGRIRPVVILISLKKNHLAKLRTALEEKLSKDDLFRLFFHNPEEVPSFLDGLPPASKEETVGGYRVTVDYEAPDEAARASRSRAIADLIARRMKTKKRGGP